MNALRSQFGFGSVKHVRYTPRRHAFRYRLSMILVDLAELPGLFRGRWLWSANGRNIASVQRRDHLHGGAEDLEQAVRDRVEGETGCRPQGRITLVTQPRYFGYCLNPISVYICWSGDGATVETIIAEVHNTPWGEQIAYVLPVASDAGPTIEARFDKKMHVSPFMPMDMRYRLRLRHSRERLALTIENYKDGQRVLSTCLLLHNEPVSGRSLARALVLTPLQTMKVVLAIHFEALRLWLKGLRYIPYPGPHQQRANKALRNSQ